MKQFLRILFAQLLVCLTIGAFAQTNVYFDNAGTYNWICPIGVTSVTLQMWGGGGPGDGGWSGGGGAFVQTTAIPVQPGQTYKVYIGSYVAPYTNEALITTFGTTDTVYVVANGATSYCAGIYGCGFPIAGAPSSDGYVAVSFAGGSGVAGYDIVTQQLIASGGGAAGSSCGKGADGTTNGGPGIGQCGAGSGAAGNLTQQPLPGGFPGGGGGSDGGNFAPKGGNGRIILTYTCSASAGSIGNAHTIAYPPELAPDKITSTVNPVLPVGGIIGWQQSTDNINFVTAKTADTTTTYRFDKDKPKTTTYYRRGNNACIADGGFGNWSDTVKIIVAKYSNGTGIRNGKVSGYVKAIDGSGISGRWVYVKSLTPLKGRAVGYLDSIQTFGSDGRFEMDSIFYGDHSNTQATPRDSANVRFLVYYDTSDHHLYKPVSIQLSSAAHIYPDITFFDSSSFGIRGQVYQICDSCLNSNNKVVKIQGPIDSVLVKAVAQNHNSSDSSKTGYANDLGTYGNYSIIIKYTDAYRITPSYLNHKFKPTDTLLNVTGPAKNINFIDTTTHVISGTFSAGCGDIIGRAVLEFDDSLHIGHDSLPQGSVFRKRVTTNSNGTYSIRLPARAYTVKVISWSGHDNADATTTQQSIIKYFNALRNDTLRVNSVYRDISARDTILNLEYHRAPQIAVDGLRDDSASVSTCPAFSNYDFWPQGIKRPIRFKVYQGPPTSGCLTDTGTVTIKTDISIDDGNFNYDTVPVVHGIATDSIVAAQPNIVKDGITKTYSKMITAKYTDVINRSFSTDTAKPALPIVVVTGAAVDPSGTNFVTVSPQLPMLVLHDPPGSTSNAEWEQEVSSSKTISFSGKSALSAGTSVSAKIGLDEIIGMFVETEISVELGIDAEFNTTKTYASTDESTITTTSVETLKTSEDPAYIGTDADIVKGQAFNIAYREGTEIDWDSATCKIPDPRPIMVTDIAGVGTTYDYTIGSLRDEEIPRLERAAIATTNPDSARFFRNQEGVWQQLIDQNEDNIKAAPVIGNKSFSNGTSDKFSSTLTNDHKNTYQFDLDIDAKLATDVGFEIAGNGLTAGVSVGFSTTIGGDSSFTSSTSTTTSYTLSDNSAGLPGNYSGDYVSVNIKKDPVYGTPMFETYAGGTQCPHEEGTVSLYHPLITADVTERKGVTKDTANFTIYLNNLSNDPTPGGKRPYILFLNASSNPAGATVLIGGTSSPDGVTYIIPNNGGQQPVTVSVIRNSGGGIYDYDNLELIMTDPCFAPVVQGFYGNPHEYSSIKLSADFASPVSNVNLVSPANNWISNKSNHDSVKVVFDSYTVTTLKNIAVQYNVPGTSVWKTITTIAKSSLGATSTTYYWKTSKLTDGAYNLRLQVTDNSSRIIYSSVASGVIDRTAPSLFGIPQPAAGTYAVGTQISFSYNENVNTILNAATIQMKDITSGQTVTTQASAFANTIIVVPTGDIIGNTGHIYRVIAKNVSDVNGNTKTAPDTSYFTVGSSTYGTGSDALNISTTPGSIYEDSKGSLAVKFIRNSKVTDTAVIYYNISGNAILNKDYTITYNKGQDTNCITGIIGLNGRIRLPKDSAAVTMYIHPINDSIVVPNKILNIFLTPGGEYSIGSNYYVTDTILNHNTVAPIITANKSTTLCSGDSVTLSTANKINGVGVKSYAWSTGAKTQSITVKTSGSYTVKVTDNKGFIGYSAPTVVTVTCGSPINLATNVLSKSSAVLKWDTISCAKKYTVKYRQVGTTTWKNDTLNSNKDTVKLLKANTTYEWKVASICQYPKVILSAYATGPDFTTPASLGEIEITNTPDYTQAISGDGFSATVYPNPASTSATLEVKGVTGSYGAIVENLQGVVLWRADNLTGNFIKIPLNNFAQGIYMVIVTDKIHKGTLKLIKQ